MHMHRARNRKNRLTSCITRWTVAPSPGQEGPSRVQAVLLVMRELTIDG